MDKNELALYYAFFAPIIVHPGWMDVPVRLKDQILIYRLLYGPTIIEEEKAHEIEALAYLVSASMVAPLNYDLFMIYTYLFRKYFDSITPDDLKKELENDTPKTLDDYRKDILDRLRGSIYKTQIEELKKKLKKEKILNRNNKSKNFHSNIINDENKSVIPEINNKITIPKTIQLDLFSFSK